MQLLDVAPIPSVNHHPRGLRPPSRLYRSWHWLRGLLSREMRDRSAHEQALAEELARVATELNARDDEVFALRHELRRKEAEIDVLKINVRLMTEVHELDRARVEADTVAYSRVIRSE